MTLIFPPQLPQSTAVITSENAAKLAKFPKLITY